MKKFNICLFILACFAAAVFWIGWTQFKVKPDTCGILISKTSGIYEKPILPGEFNWNWQFLIPTNTELKLFSIKPVNKTKTITGSLASGNIYSSQFGTSDNFDYKFTFSISLTVAPEALIDLIKLNKISNNEDLDAYLTNAADTIAQIAADYYLKKSAESSSFRPEAVRREELIKNTQSYKEFPEIELFVFALTDCKIPDYSLYQKSKLSIFSNNSIPDNTSKSITDNSEQEFSENIQENL